MKMIDDMVSELKAAASKLEALARGKHWPEFECDINAAAANLTIHLGDNRRFKISPPTIDYSGEGPITIGHWIVAVYPIGSSYSSKHYSAPKLEAAVNLALAAEVERTEPVNDQINEVQDALTAVSSPF